MKQEMLNKQELKDLKYYYQDFHHKCVGWYITVMGFFIAGLIASNPAGDLKVGVALLVLTALLSASFTACISHYSSRIHKINLILYNGEIYGFKDIAKLSFRVHGFGSWFFMVIIILMQSAVFWLVKLKYF